MPERYYLIKFEANWSDEFDCQQFMLMANENPFEYIDDLLVESSLGFGTNQEFYVGEISVNDFEVKLISKEMYEGMKELFPSRTFGVGLL